MKISANKLSDFASKFKRIPHKLKREMYKIPPVQLIQEQVYQKSLKSYSRFLPELDQYGMSIVETLRAEGTCIISLEKLSLSSTDLMMKTAFSLANNLRYHNVNNDNTCEVGSCAEDLREFPEILLWALEPKLLDIVENYIGLPTMYQYFAMRRSIADGTFSGVRRWHIDWEDRRVIKIIIYLNDVVAGGGPYDYIARNITSEAKKKLKYNNLGYISDPKMLEAVSKSDWKSCYAAKGTVIISDTGNVFHRAQPPTHNERFSITFCYTSRKPQVVWETRKVSKQQWEFIDSKISLRQKNCLNKKLLNQII